MKRKLGASLLIIFALCSCAQKDLTPVEHIVHEHPIWQGKKEVVVEKVADIGSDDFDKPDYIFGFISDIAVDKNDNVYVLDHINSRVSKFTPEGQFILHFGKGKGQGPGEFQNMHNICVDSQGNLFITDATKRVISLFDSSGNFIKEYRTEERLRPLHDIAVFGDLYLFVGIDVVSFAHGWGGGIVQVYSLPNLKYITSLGDSEWFKSHRGIFSATNRIFVDQSKGKIAISHTSPYKIEIFNQDWTLLKSFGRRAPFFDEVISDPATERIKMASGASLCMTRLPGGTIINVIRRIVQNRPTETLDIIRYFDFFDKQGVYLLTESEETFGISGRYNLQMESDGKGFIWISIIEPFPHISKYKIHFIDL